MMVLLLGLLFFDVDSAGSAVCVGYVGGGGSAVSVGGGLVIVIFDVGGGGYYTFIKEI